VEIVVIDGQGGGLGKSIIAKLRSELSDTLLITALATNDFASKAMHKAGANKSFFGENYIVSYINNNSFDALIAPIGALCPGGLNNEITHEIASAIFQKNCDKYIIPLKKHGFYIPGAANLELKDIIDEIVYKIRKLSELIS
jgi:hypothetical protein